MKYIPPSSRIINFYGRIMKILAKLKLQSPSVPTFTEQEIEQMATMTQTPLDPEGLPFFTSEEEKAEDPPSPRAPPPPVTPRSTPKKAPPSPKSKSKSKSKKKQKRKRSPQRKDVTAPVAKKRKARPDQGNKKQDKIQSQMKVNLEKLDIMLAPFREVITALSAEHKVAQQKHKLLMKLMGKIQTVMEKHITLKARLQELRARVSP